LRLEALGTEPDALGASAEEHRATRVNDAAVCLVSGPVNNFVVGAFVDGAPSGFATAKAVEVFIAARPNQAP
jgi:hypothetical protein